MISRFKCFYQNFKFLVQKYLTFQTEQINNEAQQYKTNFGNLHQVRILNAIW